MDLWFDERKIAALNVLLPALKFQIRPFQYFGRFK